MVLLMQAYRVDDLTVATTITTKSPVVPYPHRYCSEYRICASLANSQSVVENHHDTKVLMMIVTMSMDKVEVDRAWHRSLHSKSMSDAKIQDVANDVTTDDDGDDDDDEAVAVGDADGESADTLAAAVVDDDAKSVRSVEHAIKTLHFDC